MTAMDVSALARHLFTTKGPQAIAEAALKAASCRHEGDEEQARMWRRVEETLRELRGPRQG
jgi:hypothetical protein